jgi:hypothetical protein
MDTETIKKAIIEYWGGDCPPARQIVVRTGIGGMELIDEAFEKKVGYERIYMGHHVPRILRRLKIIIKKTRRGRYYRLIRTNGQVLQNTTR